jgi:hypothetical protein
VRVRDIISLKWGLAGALDIIDYDVSGSCTLSIAGHRRLRLNKLYTTCSLHQHTVGEPNTPYRMRSPYS